MPVNVLTENDFRPRSFAEAERAFARKIALTSDQFATLSAEQRRNAFRIATVNNARIVQAARDLIAKAVRDGTPFVDFRRALLALFDTQGVPRVALHRLNLVYRQNVLQAYSDARRATLDDPDIAAAFGFRRYLTVGDGTPGNRNVRPDHAALHGKVFRWNDPFWNRFTPPWDYGCRCTFVALTASQVKDRRAVVWTYKGGRVVPVSGGPSKSGRSKSRTKGFALKPKKGFGGRLAATFDLSGLDAELRRVVEERIRVSATNKTRMGTHLVDADAGNDGAPLVEIVLALDGLNPSSNHPFTVDRASANLVLKAFRARGTPLVIDYEHQSEGEDFFKGSGPVPAAGWVEDMSYETDRGIVGHVKWTEEARSLIRADKYRYLSPVTWIDEQDRLVELKSIGLVNQPAIPGLLVAAKEKPSKENNAMPGTLAVTEPGVDPDMAPDMAPAMENTDLQMGRIAELLELETAESESAMFDAILEAIRKLKGSDEKKEGDDGDEKTGGEPAEVVANLRRKLGLSKHASASEIFVALNSMSQDTSSVKAIRLELNKVKDQLADRTARDLLEPHIAANRINPRDEEDMKVCLRLAKDDPAGLAHQMERRQAYVAPGRTTAPDGGAAGSHGGAGGEDKLIEAELKAHKGNHAAAMSSLQRRLKKPYMDQGLTGKAANEACRNQYPKIFAT